MEAKIFTQKDEKDVPVFEGELGNTARYIELREGDHFLGIMGIWVSMVTGRLHIYFPGMDLKDAYDREAGDPDT